MKIAVLNFGSSEVDIINVDEKVIERDTKKYFEEDETPDMDDYIQTYLSEVCEYRMGDIEYMFGEELCVNHKRRK